MKMQNKENSARTNVLTSVFLSLLFAGLPLIFTNGFFNITQTKAVFFYILATAFIVVFIFMLPDGKTGNAELKSKFAPPYSCVDIAFMCFFFFVLVAGILSEYRNDVWIGAAARYQGVLTILLYTLMYFAVSRNLQKPNAFLLCAVVVFSVVCLFGVCNCFDIDLLGLHDRLSDRQKGAYISTIGNINFYSSYLCLLLPLVLCGFIQATNKTSRIIYTVSLLIGSFGIMVTASESFALGLSVAVAVIPLFLKDDTKKLKRYLVGIVMVILSSQLYMLLYNRAEVRHVPLSEALQLFTNPYVAAVLTAVCAVVYILLCVCPKIIKKGIFVYAFLLCAAVIAICVCFVLSNTKGLGSLDAYFRITDEWGSKRGEIWKQCLTLFKGFSLKEKLFGIGPEALQRISDGSAVFAGKVLDQAHNEYLQYLLTTGICGFVAYLSIPVTITFTVAKYLRRNTLAVGLFAGLAAYWLQATVNIAQPFTTPLMYGYIAILGGIAWNTKKEFLLQKEQ